MANILVTIIHSKIFYADSIQTLRNVVGTAIGNAGIPGGFNSITYATLTEQQFIRFKNAGKRHPSNSGKTTPSGYNRDRPDRTTVPALEKWDVDSYGELTGVSGPWGNGSLTNRDHMTANSSNQLQFQTGTWSGNAATSAQVKSEGLAITVSGEHHRRASYTYGGRTRKKDTPDGSTRMRYGANYPTQSFLTETKEMLDWKSSHLGRNNQIKNTLRVEMVGGYTYLYKLAVSRNLITATAVHDATLVNYLEAAAKNDDGNPRR